MSLVENIINQITSNGINGTSNLQNFDLNDDTFAKLLNKQLEQNETISTDNFLGQIGMPAGFVIESIDGTDFSEMAKDQAEIIGESKLLGESQPTEPIQFKTVDTEDYFTTLIKSNTEASKNYMNFAKKQATNAYDIFQKSYVNDMKDFVKDIASMI